MEINESIEYLTAQVKYWDRICQYHYDQGNFEHLEAAASKYYALRMLLGQIILDNILN